MTSSTPSVSPLRQRMLDDMRMRFENFLNDRCKRQRCQQAAVCGGVRMVSYGRKAATSYLGMNPSIASCAFCIASLTGSVASRA
jgi:hypothetical protein